MLPEPDSTGAPRDLYASRDFIVLHLDMVDLVGFDAAVLFQRIAWRCEDRDGWAATSAELQRETRLSAHRVRQALDVLRTAGWVTGERADRYNPTLTWRVVWAGQSVNVKSPVTSMPDPEPLVMQDSCITSVLKDQVEDQLPIPPAQPGQLALVADLDADFAAFYAEFPRKAGRGQALKAYRAARKVTDAGTILAGLRNQLPVLSAREVCYRPHPATWLNGQRWLDDVQALSGPAASGQNHYLAGLDASVVAQMTGRAL